MTESNFAITIAVRRTAGQAFDAAANARGWWSENIEGDTGRVDGEFTFRYKDIHYSRHRVAEFVRGKRIVWQVLDAWLTFVEDGKEWNGTQMWFDISENAGITTLRFTHVGLVPKRECYQACSNAWRYYVGDSLKALITTGRDEPDEREVRMGA